MLVAKRYRLGPSIGRGGMGEVFRATDEQLGRPVAVKLLLPSDRDPRAAERFHREARAAARLSDPHVVSVYDFGHHGEGFFLVMELVEGRTVAEEVALHGPLPKDRAIDIIEQAAAGLAAAHREDVVHRDVKPGNLLLAADGTVKVADFGIAHLPGEGTSTLTATGQLIGSTLYIAPERARGAQAGKASDVYSLGCVLYQLVTGEPPFQAEHPAAILYQHVDTAPVLPSLDRPELGGTFENVLLQMLAKDAADRPSAAEIAVGALRAHDPGPVAAVPVPVAAALDAEADAGPVGAPSWMRSKTLLAGVISVLATAAAVLAGILLNGNETRLPPTTDVNPGPSPSTAVKPSTPRTTTGPTEARTTRTTSTQPSQSTTPRTSSPPTTTSTPTTSPSEPTQSSTPPTTRATPSTTPSPSSTRPTSPATTKPPVTTTPSTGTQASATPPPAAD
nr:serine/threonine-protein kinase [Kribbella antiqua]